LAASGLPALKLAHAPFAASRAWREKNGRGSHGPARYSAGPRRDEQTIFIEGTCEHDGVVRLEQSAIADVSDI
jgi:hypothetical protein